jgi:phospholipase/carboxylesterase
MQVPIRHIERASGGAAGGYLVFFHGYYGIPEDFLAFVDKLDPGRRLHAYLPSAPYEINESRGSWFDLEDEEQHPEQLEPVARWLDGLGLPPGRCILGGWSQGASVAYALGLHAGRPRPAGIVALGGPIRESVELDAGPWPPIVVGHGREDDVVAVEWVRAGLERLRAAGADPQYLETDVDHHIDQAIVPQLRDFVAQLP